MINKKNKLGAYLAVTAGVGCVASTANAAGVIFYGNASNNNIQADPTILMLSFNANIQEGSLHFQVNTGSFAATTYYEVFTRGEDLAIDLNNNLVSSSYSYQTMPSLGVQFGSANYANVSLNGIDAVYEAVAQFYFDGMGGGYLMAIATNNDISNPQNLSNGSGLALSISAGKAMIDAAAIPEPSSLVLLALGATGLAARRQRKQAA